MPMAVCEGFTIFCSSLKGVNNYCPRRGRQNRKGSVCYNKLCLGNALLTHQSRNNVCLYWFWCLQHLTPAGFKNFLGKRPRECAVLAIKTNAFPSNGSAVMNQSPRVCLHDGCHSLLALEKLWVPMCVKSGGGGEELFLKDNFSPGRLPSLNVLDSHLQGKESSPEDHFASLTQALAPNCSVEEPIFTDSRQSAETRLAKLRLLFFNVGPSYS